jgi:hypothetical protein
MFIHQDGAVSGWDSKLTRAPSRAGTVLLMARMALKVPGHVPHTEGKTLPPSRGGPTVS